MSEGESNPSSTCTARSSASTPRSSAAPGGNIGIGFAIPVNLAKELVPQLREKGKVTRGWLGVLIQKVTPEIAESLGLEHARGALVADVVANGPAAAAGVKVGDVIVEFDGHPVERVERAADAGRADAARQDK